MRISVTLAVNDALKRTAKVLFYPFSLRKWFILGFAFFLAGLGRTGCSFQYSVRRQQDGLPPLPEGVQWLTTHAVFVAGLVVAGIILGLAVKGVMDWLASRGDFILLDGVVRDRAAISEPWSRLAAQANSYFVLRYSITVAMLFLSGFVVLCCTALAWPSISAGVFDRRAQVALLVGLVILIPMVVLFMIAQSVLSDFVVPTMYRRDLDAGSAAMLWWRELFLPHFWTFMVFYLCKIGLGIGAAFVVLLAIPLSCCLAAVPYLGSVLLLPVGVFFRSYPLYFLLQFGPEWDMWEHPPRPMPEPGATGEQGGVPGSEEG